MDGLEKDEGSLLSATDWPSHRHEDDSRQRFSHRNISVSKSFPVSSSDSGATSLVGFPGPLCSGRNTPSIQMSGLSHVNQKGNPSRSIHGSIDLERQNQVEEAPVRTHDHRWGDGDYLPKNEHLLRSGPLGMCSDCYCTECPTSYNDEAQETNSRASLRSDHHSHNVLHGGAKEWAGKKLSLLKQYTFVVKHPHTKVVQQWNQFFVISCLLAIFVDPLFFYLLSVKKDNKCIVINGPMTNTIVVFRSFTDLIYLMHMLVQFRLAFVPPESRVPGAGDLVDHRKKIAPHYLSGFFFLDLFIVLPLPQIMVLFVLPKVSPLSGANDAKNLLRAAVLIQYIPRLYRFLPLLEGQSPSGFIFESAWANFFINLLTFVLAGHVVGSCWYLFGLQRVNQCLRDACHNSQIGNCKSFIDCGHGIDLASFEADQTWNNWKQNENSTACFSKDGFDYGIYVNAVNLTVENSIITRYVYSFFWGFQQISTLAGNQTPSYFVWEVLFTMGIIGLGLLLFALLIGNMQNFLQGLGRRRLEMSLRRRDIEQWMSHRHLPEDLRAKVRESERYHWAATQGVKEEMLMENLPEDLQRDIRRHLFQLIKKIFAAKDEPMLDAIFERLRQKTYIKGCIPLCEGGVVTNMIFIVRGKMGSKGEDGNTVELSMGDVCGEELLTWCLEHSSVNGDIKNHKKTGCRLLSNRTVQCLTNVEAFVLRAADLEEVTSLFAGRLRNLRVQIAMRSKSPYGRHLAATCIQVAWRYWKKQLRRHLAATCIQVAWRYWKKRLSRAYASHRNNTLPQSFD